MRAQRYAGADDELVVVFAPRVELLDALERHDRLEARVALVHLDDDIGATGDELCVRLPREDLEQLAQRCGSPQATRAARVRIASLYRRWGGEPLRETIGRRQQRQALGRVPYRAIARAAAEVARDRLRIVPVAPLAVVLGEEADHEPRRAVPALRPALAHHRLLNGVQALPVRDPFDRHDLLPRERSREHQAPVDRVEARASLAVAPDQRYGAGAALALRAALLAPGQPPLAQEPEQRRVRVDALERELSPVHEDHRLFHPEPMVLAPRAPASPHEPSQTRRKLPFNRSVDFQPAPKISERRSFPGSAVWGLNPPDSRVPSRPMSIIHRLGLLVLILSTALGAGCGSGDSERENADLRQQLDELRAQYDETASRLSELEHQNQEMLARLNEAGANIETTEQARAELARQLAEARAREEAQRARLAAFRHVIEQFRALVQSGQLSVVIRNGKMVVQLPEGVLFDSGRADLKPEGQETLRAVAGILAQIENREFLIAGHTDNIPIRSRRFPSNWSSPRSAASRSRASSPTTASPRSASRPPATRTRSPSPATTPTRAAP